MKGLNFAYDNIFATHAFCINHRQCWKIKRPHRPSICNLKDCNCRVYAKVANYFSAFDKDGFYTFGEFNSIIGIRSGTHIFGKMKFPAQKSWQLILKSYFLISKILEEWQPVPEKEVLKELEMLNTHLVMVLLKMFMVCTLSACQRTRFTTYIFLIS